MKDISPFIFEKLDTDDTYSLTLDAGEGYKSELFLSREDEGFIGNGYDWESLALVYLNECAPHLINAIEFDSEAEMFCVYSSDRGSITEFAEGFTAAVSDDERAADLFSRAEII